jgi:hypothetical protein
LGIPRREELRHEHQPFPVPGRHSPAAQRRQRVLSEIAAAIAGEGRHSAEGHDSDELHRSVAENVDHLVHLGLVEYSGSGADRAAALTTVGSEAVSSLA